MRVSWIARLLSLALVGTAHSFAADSARVDELKAAYLFNFAKLIEWSPATPMETLTICFVGASGVHDAFARTAGDKQVGARHIVVRHADAHGAASGCDVVYIESALAGDAGGDDVTVSGALTVSDAQDFAAHGGMIELFSEGNRLRFNINLPSAQRAGLRISSSLLQLAARIEKGSAR